MDAWGDYKSGLYLMESFYKAQNVNSFYLQHLNLVSKSNWDADSRLILLP